MREESKYRAKDGACQLFQKAIELLDSFTEEANPSTAPPVTVHEPYTGFGFALAADVRRRVSEIRPLV